MRGNLAVRLSSSAVPLPRQFFVSPFSFAPDGGARLPGPLEPRVRGEIMDINCKCRWLRRCAAILKAPRLGALPILAVAFSISFLAASPAAAQECIVDQQAADDEPGQKDLTELCEDPGDGTPFDLLVSFNFDDNEWAGANTGDGCALFDTDGDSFANFALCVTVEDGAPADQAAGSPRLFQCTTDSRVDRCVGAEQHGVCQGDGFCGVTGEACINDNNCPQSFSSECEVNDPQEDQDPFDPVNGEQFTCNAGSCDITGNSCTVDADCIGDDGHTGNVCKSTSANCRTKDTYITCSLDGDDLPGDESCDNNVCANSGDFCENDGDCIPLTDVCSYPSEQPNSDPSDCVITPTGQDPCLGVDCSNLTNSCNTGVCNPSTGVCESQPFSATTICRAGSGDLCDPDESCTGVVGAACPTDTIAPATTFCRLGSGDLCDPNESCTGLAGAVCPADLVASATTICNPGSGDLCDPDESCTGVTGAACPADRVASATTICNAGSGDICDPDESCTGAADAGCPADRIASATTICNAGSGDLCDPDESCTGAADAGCPADRIASATTICNAGSGDICDPDESCTGVADATCPADRIASATTICNPGSGDICDEDESCSGVADAACPDDTVASATTICREGSGDICDPDESCTGVAGAACPADVVASATTICNEGSGDICDPDESCSGGAGEPCPVDTIASATTICRPSTDDEVCDPAESCTGVEDEFCPIDVLAGPDVECDDGDPCTGTGVNPDVCVEGECTPGEPNSLCGICRTPGFWGARAGVEKGGFNYTQAVLDSAGCLHVCGVDICGTDVNNLGIGHLGSAIEAICVQGNEPLNQGFRQLTAAALNCELSGFGDDCGGLFDQFLFGSVNGTLVNWENCNDSCALASNLPLLNTCSEQIDCWNNGFTWVELDGVPGLGPNDGCASGECSIDGAPCGVDAPGCAPNVCVAGTCSLTGVSCAGFCAPAPQLCVPVPGCHNVGLCESPLAGDELPFFLVGEFDPVSGTCVGESLGQASSQRVCLTARGNLCTISSSLACATNPCDNGDPLSCEP